MWPNFKIVPANFKIVPAGLNSSGQFINSSGQFINSSGWFISSPGQFMKSSRQEPLQGEPNLIHERQSSGLCCFGVPLRVNLVHSQIQALNLVGFHFHLENKQVNDDFHIVHPLLLPDWMYECIIVASMDLLVY